MKTVQIITEKTKQITIYDVQTIAFISATDGLALSVIHTTGEVVSYNLAPDTLVSIF